jgi:hypothetical protein
MTLRSKREAQLSRKKLETLEEMYTRARATQTENPRTRELTLRTLRRTINQLTEEITRFEARTTPANTDAS